VVRILVEAGIFLFSPPHPDRLWGPPIDTGGCFPGGKAAGLWSWPLTSI